MSQSETHIVLTNATNTGLAMDVTTNKKTSGPPPGLLERLNRKTIPKSTKISAEEMSSSQDKTQNHQQRSQIKPPSKSSVIHPMSSGASRLNSSSNNQNFDQQTSSYNSQLSNNHIFTNNQSTIQDPYPNYLNSASQNSNNVFNQNINNNNTFPNTNFISNSLLPSGNSTNIMNNNIPQNLINCNTFAISTDRNLYNNINNINTIPEQSSIFFQGTNPMYNYNISNMNINLNNKIVNLDYHNSSVPLFITGNLNSTNNNNFLQQWGINSNYPYYTQTNSIFSNPFIDNQVLAKLNTHNINQNQLIEYNIMQYYESIRDINSQSSNNNNIKYSSLNSPSISKTKSNFAIFKTPEKSKRLLNLCYNTSTYSYIPNNSPINAKPSPIAKLYNYIKSSPILKKTMNYFSNDNFNKQHKFPNVEKHSKSYSIIRKPEASNDNPGTLHNNIFINHISKDICSDNNNKDLIKELNSNNTDISEEIDNYNNIKNLKSEHLIKTPPIKRRPSFGSPKSLKLMKLQEFSTTADDNGIREHYYSDPLHRTYTYTYHTDDQYMVYLCSFALLLMSYFYAYK